MRFHCKMNEYLLLNIIIISFPLAATFYSKIGYYKKLPQVLSSILFVGAIFILWDILATERGHWAFNPAYVLGIRFMGLPVEELMFFVSVPFSCLFIYESLCTYVRDFSVPFSKNIFVGVAVFMLLMAVPSFGREYSFAVFLAAGFFLLFAAFFLQDLLSSGRYWAYLGITLLLFVIFNFILTSLPIVSYGPKMIWGTRFLTIPLEDFLYNYLMLSLYLGVYIWAKKKVLSQ
jgi:lycopene cyclase domain-containing protein